MILDILAYIGCFVVVLPLAVYAVQAIISILQAWRDMRKVVTEDPIIAIMLKAEPWVDPDYVEAMAEVDEMLKEWSTL